MKTTFDAACSGMMAPCVLVALFAATAAEIALPSAAAAGSPSSRESVRRQDPQWPPVVATLEGAWEGSGTLFGNPASFTMRWERSLRDRFLRLSFTNSLVADGGTTPVLSAEAFYRIGEPGELTGYWFDTRGEIVTLRARVADDRVVTDWQASTENGRTTYRVIDADTVEVVDEVQGPDGWREFGRASYRRQR